MRETIYQERVGHVLALKMDRLFRDVQIVLGSVDELNEALALISTFSTKMEEHWILRLNG